MSDNGPAIRSLAEQSDHPFDPPTDPLAQNTGYRSPIFEVQSQSITESLTEIRNVFRQLVVVETARASASPAPAPFRAPAFTSKDRSKLRPLLSALRVVYLNHTSCSVTDRNKVLYAGSHFTNIAAEWFEPFNVDTAKRWFLMIGLCS